MHLQFFGKHEKVSYWVCFVHKFSRIATMWLIVLSLMILGISDFLQPLEPSIIPEFIPGKCVSDLLILSVCMGRLELCNPFASVFLTLLFMLLQPYSRRSLCSKLISVQQLLVSTKAYVMSVRHQQVVSQQSELLFPDCIVLFLCLVRKMLLFGYHSSQHGFALCKGDFRDVLCL